jgi:hypothetical protein
MGTRRGTAVHRTAPGQDRQAHGRDPLSNAHKSDSSQTVPRAPPRETPTRVYWNPSGNGLLGPIDAELRGAKRLIHIKSNNRLHNALQSFSTLIMVLGKCPSHCRELVVDNPGYIGFCDASKLGAGRWRGEILNRLCRTIPWSGRPGSLAHQRVRPRPT